MRGWKRIFLGLGGLFLGLADLYARADLLQLPTANRSLFEPGQEDHFFVGTVGKSWSSGAFGSVRSGGRQLHEGIDIKCLQRDKKGEATDPVLAAADGTVAYINAQSALSNYGRYVVLRHHLEGLEIYTLYAHLREVQPGLKAGQSVKAGGKIAVLGRSTNTREGISKDRAHLHFEINLLVNERFPGWYKKAYPNQRNDHGLWNGHNLVGLDPRWIFLAQQKQGPGFSLLNFIRHQPQLCRVLVRDTRFPWLQRYAPLIRPNPTAQKEGVAGYEVALNFNAVITELIPRAASEIKGKARFQLLTVNESEAQKNPCQHLVAHNRSGWQLSPGGIRFFELLTY